jgi:flagellar protein FliL
MAAAPSLDPAASGSPARKGSSLAIQAALLLAATVIAAGVGFVGGGTMKPPAEGAQAEAQPPAAQHGEAGGKKPGGHGEEAPVPEAGKPAVVALSPLTANLAAPADVWLRLELGVEFADGADAGLAGEVESDFLAYLRTLKLHQLEGPSGLIHLKEDLEERAAIRTANKISHVFVRAMLIE